MSTGENQRPLTDPPIRKALEQQGIIPIGAKTWVHSLNLYTAADLKKMAPKPPEFIIQGFLSVGLCIFAAPRKSGKSWACLQLCDAIAHGKPFLGFPTTAGDCLYLDLEGREYSIYQRFQTMQIEFPAEVTIAHDAATTDTGLLDQIEGWRKNAKNPKVIIIDVIQRVKGRGKPTENAYESDYRIYAPIHQYAMEHKIAVIAVTHVSKARAGLTDPYDAVTGSAGSTGVASTIWVLQKDPTGNGEFLLSATSRDFEEKALQVQLCKNPVKWICYGEQAAVNQTREEIAYNKDPIVKTIKAAVKTSGFYEATASEILQRVADETGEYPIIAGQSGQGRALSVKLKALQPLLFNYDNIRYVAPTYGGKKGRIHRFYLKTDLIEG